MYHHYTTATDSVNAKVVFDMVIDQIIKENMSATQLLWQPVKFILYILDDALKYELLIMLCLQMLFSIKAARKVNDKEVALYPVLFLKDFK